MSDPTLDIVAIGNAIVDVIAQADDAFIATEGLTKGSMQLLFSTEEAEALYAKMGQAVETSGGSAANTIAGIAALGGKTGFIGQVANDQLGHVFEHDIKTLGVEYTTSARDGEPATARCLILVTLDGERTMNTFLGASQFLPAAALDHELIEKSAILYLEGYLWDPEEPRAAMDKAIDIAKSAGRRVAFTLSDTFCVDRHRDDFLALLDKGRIDILFANEDEIKSLQETEDFDEAVAKTAAQTPLLVVTRSEKGAIAVKDGETHKVSAEPIDRVVDATGAGDQFAAGFLKGQAEGRSIADSLTMGAMCAAEVIQHVGPRPESGLRQSIDARLG
jgi:sugar/nucleoside kinase (ribokinase family)